MLPLYVSFFFQAEDGIRDRNVTGVQTCALPIYLPRGGAGQGPSPGRGPSRGLVPSGRRGRRSMRAVASEPQLKSVRAHGWRRGSMRTESAVRSFTVVADEPHAVGGTDTAPTPMELIAGAVNGCLGVVVETVAAELGLTLRALETTSHAHIDVRGFQGTAEVSPHFRDYRLTVTV